jgi:ribosomal protein S18 acetylase RimI-like enzyme
VSTVSENIQVRDFTMEYYDGALALWQRDTHIGLSSADGREALESFLRRNNGLSKVAFDEGQLVGTVLCGHDGRRGYIYHLYVQPEHRRDGMATLLVDACLENLKRDGIQKCHLFIFRDNDGGKRFWAATSWKKRDDIEVFSRDM